MRTKTILTACLVIVAATLNAQNFEWVKTLGSDSDDYGFTIRIDNLGNIYTTGGFYGTIDFDPGPDTYNLTSAGGRDGFVQKLDASGNFLWARSFGGTANDFLGRMTIDGVSGDIYFAGVFSGTIDFDMGVGTYDLTSAGMIDVFLLKMDTDGNFLWASAFGAVSQGTALSSDVDASGNVYTTGSFQGTADFDQGIGTHNLTSAGGDDIFIQKTDASGNFLWAFAFGGSSISDSGYAICTDASGNSYTVGAFNGTIDFDPGAGTFNLTAVLDTAGIFIQKLDSDGNFVWAKKMEGPDMRSYFITADDSGNIYNTGYFIGPFDFDPGPGTELLQSSSEGSSGFVQKLDASGNLLWAKAFGAAADNIEVSIDPVGNVYSVGSFYSTGDFDPGPGTAILTLEPVGLYHAGGYIHKMDSSGNFLWVRGYEGNPNGEAVAQSIAVDGLGNIYTTGNFAGNVDFNPGPGTTYITSNDSKDIFVHKMIEGTEVNGYVFVDANENGEMDEEETLVPNQSISYYNASDVDVTNNEGFFRAFPPLGNQEFNYQPPTYYINTTPVSQSVDVQIGVIDTLYFGIEPISDMNDLVVDIHAYASPRPGFTRNYLLSYQNVGTTALNDVVIKFLKTEEDDLVIASGVYTVSNDTLIWSLGTLEPFSNGSFTITHTLSTSAVLGDYTYTQAWILPTSDDETPLNNAIALEEEIIGSYDPNDKSVTPETSEPTENEPLEYTIRFQNTGNFQADFVVVKDTLDTQLDLSTFQMIAASHQYEVEIVNRIATWTFNEINLPDSTSDEAGSHGFIKFKVQRIDGLGVGTQIPNSVAIYFDYNEPVITNTCIYSIETCVATIGTTLNGVTITANNDNATYQWLDCDNNNEPIEGATSQTFTATESGNYAVEVTEDGCTNTSACVAVTIIGIDEWNNELLAAVYPNPSQGNVEITLGGAMKDVELMLTDIQGRVIFTRNYPSLFKTNIELPDAKGVYILKLKAQDSTSTLRLVKE